MQKSFSQVEKSFDKQKVLGQALVMSSARPFATMSTAEIIAIIEESSTREHADAVRANAPGALDDVLAYTDDLATGSTVTSTDLALAENLSHAVAELRLRAHSGAP